MLWHMDQAPQVMRYFLDFFVKAPPEINGFFAFLTVPPAAPFPEDLQGKKMCGIVWCYTGLLDQAESVFQPIRQFGPPALDFVGRLPFPALQGMFDATLPPGLHQYWRADFHNDLDAQAIALHVKFGETLPTPLSTAHIYPINGAAHRVGKNETAFSYRDANFVNVIVAADSAPNEKMATWVKDYWQALHPYSSGGAYVNFMMDEGQERVKATYRDNYTRLAAVKAKYDPDNFFHINQNIHP